MKIPKINVRKPAMYLKLLAGISLIGLVAYATSIAVFASAPDANGKITACYDNGSAEARIIDTSNQNCNSGESEISWRQNGSLPRVMNGRNFTGAIWTYFNLTGANLSNSDFTNANLTGSNLTGAQVGGAVFTNTIFVRAVLPSIDFHTATLGGLQFDEATLDGSSFAGATLMSSGFTGASVKKY